MGRNLHEATEGVSTKFNSGKESKSLNKKVEVTCPRCSHAFSIYTVILLFPIVNYSHGRAECPNCDLIFGNLTLTSEDGEWCD